MCLAALRSDRLFVLEVRSLPILCNSFLLGAPHLHCESGVDPPVFAFDVVTLGGVT